MRDLADGRAARARARDVRPVDRRRGLRRNLRRIDAQPERERAQDRQLRARIVAVEVGGRVRFGVAERLRRANGAIDRAAGLLDERQDGVGRGVQDRVDARDAVAGEAVADRADDRDRAADGRLEAKLPPLARGERQQRRAVPRDRLFVRRDDGFAGGERGANPLDRRVDAADRFDDDVGVALEHVGDLGRPGDAGERRMPAFLLGAAVEHVCEADGRRAIRIEGRQPARDGGADGAEAEQRDAAAGG